MSLKPPTSSSTSKPKGSSARQNEAVVWPEYDAELADLYLVDWRRLLCSQRREPLFPDQGIDVFEGSTR